MITEQDRLIARTYGPPPRPMSLWFRLLFAGMAIITLVNLVAPGDREFRVTLLLFWVVFTMLAGVWLVVAPQRGRITITRDTLNVRVRYSFRVSTITRDRIRRLVVCGLRSVGPRRYALLVILGDADRCLAQIALDHYTDDDVAAVVNALGSPTEGNWSYQPTMGELQIRFPGFKTWNKGSVVPATWISLLVVASALIAWALTPVVLR